MKRKLRHPIRSITEPYGKAGLLVAILALVLATTGAAFAAKGGLTGKQKKEVTKIAKKYAGKNGTNGTNGAPGDKGDKGDQGDQGDQGIQGIQGVKGDTGNTGPAGVIHPGNPVGSPQPLPSEATETGSWAASTTGLVPISFPIPLETELPPAGTHFVLTKVQEGKIGGGAGELCEGETNHPPNGPEELSECEEPYKAVQAACPGTASAPEAETGNLCIYEGFSSEGPGEGTNLKVTAILPAGKYGAGASTAGAVIAVAENEPGAPLFWGTFAVTAP